MFLNWSCHQCVCSLKKLWLIIFMFNESAQEVVLQVFKSSGAWCCVNGWASLNIWKDCITFVFRDKQSSRLGLVILKMKVIQYFEMSSNTHPTTQHHIAGDVSLQQHHCDNLTSFKLFILLCSNCIKNTWYNNTPVFKYIIKPQVLTDRASVKLEGKVQIHWAPCFRDFMTKTVTSWICIRQ